MLYDDALATLVLDEEGGVSTPLLTEPATWGEGASVLSDLAEMEGDNAVWSLQFTAGSNISLNTSPMGEGLQDRVKFVNMAENAEFRFRLKVLEKTEGATKLSIKLDSPYPIVSAKEIEMPELDVWTDVVVRFSELVGDLNYDTIHHLLVVEPQQPNSVTHILLDDIRIVCPAEAECAMEPVVVNTIEESFDVYADGVPGGTHWEGLDIGAWGSVAIEGVTDVDRGPVLEVAYTGGGIFMGMSSTKDLSAFATGGYVTFDVKVLEGSGFVTVKVDGATSTSGDIPIAEQAPTGVWHTLTVPVSTLTDGGLNLDTVTSPFVIFPKDFAPAKIQLDNIRWELPTP